jgi:hypothetical protein
LQRYAVEAEVAPQTRAHQDLFGINVGAGKAERFDADLMKLTITPFLRSLVPEHLAHIVEPLRLLRHEIVLDGGAYAAGGTFGTQCQCFAVERIDKGIHFLLDNVGHFADSALEQRCRLDDRQADRAVTIALEPRTDGFLEKVPEFGLVGQDIVHPAHRLDLRSHHQPANFLW